MLGPIIKGVDLRIQGPGGAVRREVVAVDGLDHADEAVRIWGASQDCNRTGSGQANKGTAVPSLVASKELRRAKQHDGSVCSQSSRSLSSQVEAEGLNMLGSDVSE